MHKIPQLLKSPALLFVLQQGGDEAVGGVW
jgi:hypothetical protein